MKKIKLKAITTAVKNFLLIFSRLPKPKSKGLLLGLGLLIIVILIPSFFIVRAILNTYQALQHLKITAYQVKTAAVNQDLYALEDSLNKSRQALENVRLSFTFFAPFQKLPWLGGYVSDGQLVIDAGLKLTDAGLILVEGLKPHADLLGLKGKGSFKGGTIQERLVILSQTLDKQETDIAKMAADFNQAYQLASQIDPNRYPENFRGIPVRQKIITAQSQLDRLLAIVNRLPQTVKILPFLLGSDKETRYLVLLQNDAEIRPSGGFITAYANLAMKRGLITNSFSQDIYTLDAKFKSRIPAPKPIKEYLVNIPYWYLRDMNLSPDFKVSMETFYPNYTKIAEPADVVIALDTQFLTQLLEVLGDIDLPGYGSFSAKHDPDCNCPQAIYKLEKIVDQPRATIVTDRKSVLGPLMRALIDKTLSAQKDKWPLLVERFLSLAFQKHILFYSTNQDIQQVAEAWNFAGRVLPTKSDSDYLMIVDANMGGAKSNLYITQEVDQKYQLESDGSIIKTVSISYRNPQPWSNCNLESGGLCLNGEYRDWLRLYLPKGSQLIKATNSFTKVQTYEDLGKTVFEAYIKLRPQGFHRISFTYKLPFKLNSFDNYKILIQKQSGSKTVKHRFIFPEKQFNFNLNQDSWISYDQSITQP